MAEATLMMQLSCVRRELALRERVYPRQVEGKKMSQAFADQELATMRAVLLTLERAQEQADDAKGTANGRTQGRCS